MVQIKNSMYVQLYMAISIDGFIARKNDDTSWVSSTDWDNFRAIIKDCGVIVMGRKTCEVSGSDFPYENALNIVLTTDKNLHNKQLENVLFTDKNPQEIVKLAEERGFKKLLIIGGGITNSAFLKSSLIDEIILSVHPLVIGEGIKLFEKEEFDAKLQFLGVKELKEDLVQLRYKVVY